ncbi:oxidoreductase [Umezawaea tangerina]|uniref:NADP-dependent 3-hydroxy acid dehydrogenase YdfG n=1 Tax=Umezawaea tangerina TaxID=84725 RepID=A0A2T0T7Y7_9PSEU|nr:oxidoreductase [Umezawaea tangerina]PRY41757.1 NADP-dependent 3-hydroxy acid dehydrogenase YdfG [Umezawaea tangerina]
MAAKRWKASDVPDQSGRTVVVTGASSGIGLVTARELARAGAHVVLAVRDRAKGERVAADMTGSVEVRELDLGDLASVRAFASAWSGDLDVLVNNAGVMRVPEGRTVDGFEVHLGTNHLGPFALTTLLLPRITDRVVTVSSFLHAKGRIDLDGRERPYDGAQAYNDTKLANVLFALELQRRLAAAGSPVRSFAAHPGLASTNLLGHVGGFQSLMLPLVGQSPDQGALPTLYAATQDLPGGSYVGPDGFRGLRGHPVVQQPSATARDPELARGLWELSARLTSAGRSR